ncbi:MAG TPA: tetratricopeptide repeat protein [Edaphobacter sp.]
MANQPALRDAISMKTTGRIIASALLILLGAPSFAEQTRQPKLLQSEVLSLHGQPCAVISILESRLQAAQRDLRGANSAFRLAIEVLTRDTSPRDFMSGTVYALRGQVFEYIGEHPQAISDYQNALDLFEETTGKDSPAYIRVQCSYAHALRNASYMQQASLKKNRRSCGQTLASNNPQALP